MPASPHAPPLPATAAQSMLLRMSFQTTRWSLIQRARGGDAAGRQALDQLLTAYWQPVYVFYRRLGADRDAAADLTQGLFADLLARGDLAAAAPERGRFRSFLRACARHWWAHERERAAAQKRGGHLQHVPLDRDDTEAWLRTVPVDADDPEAVFERRWAQDVLDRALWRLEQDEIEAGRSAQFARLRPCLDGSPPPTSWALLATELDTTEGALRVAAYRLKERLRLAITAEVRETLSDDRPPGEELRQLLVGPIKYGEIALVVADGPDHAIVLSSGPSLATLPAAVQEVVLRDMLTQAIGDLRQARAAKKDIPR